MVSFKVFLFIICVCATGFCFGQQEPDSLTERDRKFFDFLIGSWKISSRQMDSTTTYGGEDIYTFNKIFAGAINSNWHFNRGTKEKPNIVDAHCYIAYNNLTRNWSFYYISDLSAQYYDGRKENGNWFFYRSFNFGNGNKFLQRQYWKLVNQKTLERHTENSHDNGENWKSFSISTLIKQSGN